MILPSAVLLLCIEMVIAAEADPSEFLEARLQVSQSDLGSLNSLSDSLTPAVPKLLVLPDDTAIRDIHLRHVVWDTLVLHEAGDAFARLSPQSTPLVSVSRDGYLRGYHLAQLLIHPLRSHGNDGLLVAREIRVELELRALSPDESASVFRIRRPGPESIVPWIGGTVVNPGQLREFYPAGGGGTVAPLQEKESTPYGGFRPAAWPSLEGPPVDQVIITDDRSLTGASTGGMTDVFRSYARWKTERGVPTVVARVSDIAAHYPGFDLVERIKAYLEDAVRDWGVRWVLLGGDVQIVPTRRLDGGDRPGHLRPDPPADIYYVRFGEDWNQNGDPYIWDDNDDLGPLDSRYDQAWIGRLPCRDAREAEAMTRKIRSYLADSQVHPEPGYYESVLLATGPVNSVLPQHASSGYNSGEQVIVPFREAAWPDTVRLYAEVGFHSEPCNGIPAPCYEQLYSFLDALDVTPWRGDALHSHLARGYHIVWHLEHSTRDFLGRPTVLEPLPAPIGCPDPDWAVLCRRHLASSWGSTEVFTKEQALELQNGPRYSIVFSAGSFTSELDMDTVGEAFLRSPNGGAVAYIGKELSFGGYGTDIATGLYENILHEGLPSVGQALSLAIFEGVPSIRRGLSRSYQFPLLGDPEMEAWSRTPSSLEIAVTPDTLRSLGVQEIRITVRDGSFGGGVAGARVCLMQGELAYGIRETDGDGEVAFRGFPVLSEDPLLVSVTSPDFFPWRSEIVIQPTRAYLSYDSHRLSDSPGGDGDGDLEAGETARLDILARNRGGRPAGDPELILRVTAPVGLDLRINDEPLPDRIAVGSSASRPSNAVFTIPPSGSGFRVEGKPVSPEWGYKIWRGQDGFYVLEATARDGASDDFNGSLVTSGSFDHVTLLGEEDDQLLWKGDTIAFHFIGDPTADALRFRAEAPEWIQLESLDDGSPHPPVDPGEGLTRSWNLSLDGSAPDGFTMPFTLTAFHDDSTTTHADFSLTWKAPLPELLFLEESVSTTIPRSTAVLRPVLRNAGQSEWPGLTLVLRKVEGIGEIEDSISVFPEVGPGETAVATDSLVLVGNTSDTLRQLRLEVWAQIGSLSRKLGESRGSGDPPAAPANLRVDSQGEGFVLRWDPVEDADRYAVHLAPLDGESAFLGFARKASRFEVVQVDGARDDHRFQVRACRGLRCGEPATSEADRIWLPEAESWPKLVPDGVRTAPKVLPSPALNGRGAVFVAGRRIYAWLDDGSPLRSGEEHADGLFYDPQLPALPRRYFTESLALFRFEEDGGATAGLSWAIAGNVPEFGLIVLRLVPEEDGVHWRPEPYWQQPISSSLSAPVVWPLLDSNRPFAPQILLPADDNVLHAWMYDGTPLLSQFADGALGKSPDGSGANYRSLAVAKSAEPFRYNLIQATRAGHLVCWAIPKDLDAPALLQPLWDVNLQGFDIAVARYSLSPPAVGDVDGDGDEEVVVTNQTGPPGGPDRIGRVWMVDPLTGEIEASAESGDWSFRSPESDHPAPRPALSNLDGRPGLEIVLAGRVDDEENYVARHRVHVLALRNDGIRELTCEDEPPLPSMNSGNIDASIIWRSPVLFDVDGDGFVEILASSASGNLFLWEHDDDLQHCRGETGWPMIFGDVVMTPAVEDLDGDGSHEMAVAVQDGTVHLFRLPEGHVDPSPWNQYGTDLGNSSRAPVVFEFRGPGIAMRGATPSGFLSITPVPFRPRQRIRFALSDPERVRLDVIDITGRRVRTLTNQTLETGVHQATWDGRDEGGRSVASGVYFYRLSLGGRPRIHRTLLIR